MGRFIYCLFACVLATFFQVGVVSIENATTEEILGWAIPDNLLHDEPYYLSGYGKGGEPVWVMEVGKWDIRAIMEKGGESVVLYKKYLKQMFTREVESGKKSGVGSILILDMEGFNIRQASHIQTITMWMEAFRMFEETVHNGGLKRAFLVYCNELFVHFLEVGKPLLGRIQNDLEVHGMDSAKWIPRLLEFIPKNQLPEYLGGIKDFKPVQVY